MPEPWVWLTYCSRSACLPSAAGMRYLEITLAISTPPTSPLSCAPNPLLCPCAKLSPASSASSHTDRAPPSLLPLSTPPRQHHLCCSPPALLKERRVPFSSPSAGRIGEKFAASEQSCYIKRLPTYECHHLIWRSGCIKPFCAMGQVLTSAQGQAQQRTQLLTSQSYTGSIHSPLCAWKISTRDTEREKLTGITWLCLWYPFLGDFYTQHLLRSRALHPIPLTTTTTPSHVHFSSVFFPTFPCFLCSGRTGERRPLLGLQ